MPTVNITSNDVIALDQNFRVTAGPGAGKTHWLIEHIKNVLQNSKALGSTRKVACITYTNIAADTIIKRLDFAADRVEIATIHSFIYNNIIKPYFSFIAADFEFDVQKLDGHDDHYIGRTTTTNWIKEHPNKSSFTPPYSERQMLYGGALDGIRRWLETVRYTLDGDSIDIAVTDNKAVYFTNGSRRNVGKATCLDKLRGGLWEYKKRFWRRGIMHHDDVLFFGYTLLKKYPFIIKILRAKYPYFFVDEFQDTNPIQSTILKLLSNEAILIGVIGDPGQSIYEFQGAIPRDFSRFNLPSLADFLISDNRRSTESIVDVLNAVRTDITQTSIRRVIGSKPKIYVGSLSWALASAKQDLSGDTLVTLSRNNLIANSIKRQFGAVGTAKDLMETFLSEDSSSDRRRIILTCIKSVELARDMRFKDAIKELAKALPAAVGTDQQKKIAFYCLQKLLAELSTFKSAPLKTFFNLIKSFVRTDMPDLRTGKALTFYDGHTYEQVALGVNITDDISFDKTVHKSKGDEFKNVLVVLSAPNDLNFLLKPDLWNNEEHRVYYVAASRARDTLSITVPSILAEQKKRLAFLFDFVEMPIVGIGIT